MKIQRICLWQIFLEVNTKDLPVAILEENTKDLPMANCFEGEYKGFAYGIFYLISHFQCGGKKITAAREIFSALCTLHFWEPIICTLHFCISALFSGGPRKTFCTLSASAENVKVQSALCQVQSALERRQTVFAPP